MAEWHTNQGPSTYELAACLYFIFFSLLPPKGEKQAWMPHKYSNTLCYVPAVKPHLHPLMVFCYLSFCKCKHWTWLKKGDLYSIRLLIMMLWKLCQKTTNTKCFFLYAAVPTARPLLRNSKLNKISLNWVLLLIFWRKGLSYPTHVSIWNVDVIQNVLEIVTLLLERRC